MRIVIDLQGAQSESRYRGIGRYTTSLALAMARNCGAHEIWLVLNGSMIESIDYIRHSFKKYIPEERIRVFKVPRHISSIGSNNERRIAAAKILREHFIKSLQPDVVIVTSLFEGYLDDSVTSVSFSQFARTYTAIIHYDLIPLVNQDRYLLNQYQKDYYFEKVDDLKKADLLLAISESSRQEVMECLGVEEGKVVSISSAISDEFKVIELSDEHKNQVKNKFNIKNEFIMYAPGGFDERKNIDRLLKAFSMLSADIRTKYQLIIPGNICDNNRRLIEGAAQTFGLKKDDLLLPGYLTDDDIIALFNMTSVFVFPSRHEGFGLPVLEAMACGAPVIGSCLSSIPEVIGWEEALFDPLSEKNISEKISRVLTDEKFAAELVNRGLERSKEFSWDLVGELVLAALEKNIKEDELRVADNRPYLVEPLITDLCSIEGLQDEDLVWISDAVAFNTADQNEKALLIDISELVQRDAKSGIQRVVRSLLQELLRSPPVGYRVLPIYFDDKRYRCASNFIANGLGFEWDAETDDIAEFTQGDIYLGLDLNAHLASRTHEIHKGYKAAGVQMYYVVYDLLLVHRPDWWPEGTAEMFNGWLHSIVENATGLVCISASVANDVHRWLKNNCKIPFLPHVHSFHLGADVESSIPTFGLPDDAGQLLDKLKNQISFLMVGTVEPRKGHGQVLQAMEYLWEAGLDINLVVIGKKGWLVDDLVLKMQGHGELNRHLFWLDGISDEYLEKVYSACTVLVAASEGEGFGLPLIEAAQKGLPIIARNLDVFLEVAGANATYFSGSDPAELANVFSDWIEAYKSGSHTKSNDLPWLTWKESAGQLLSCLGLAAEASGGGVSTEGAVSSNVS